MGDFPDRLSPLKLLRRLCAGSLLSACACLDGVDLRPLMEMKVGRVQRIVSTAGRSLIYVREYKETRNMSCCTRNLQVAVHLVITHCQETRGEPEFFCRNPVQITPERTSTYHVLVT